MNIFFFNRVIVDLHCCGYLVYSKVIQLSMFFFIVSVMVYHRILNIVPCAIVTVSRSVVSDSLRPYWTVACWAPLSLEFSRQEYWSGQLFPSPADLHDPGIALGSPALPADSLTV